MQLYIMLRAYMHTLTTRRNGMHDLENVGLVVWRRAESPGMETVEPRTPVVALARIAFK